MRVAELISVSPERAAKGSAANAPDPVIKENLFHHLVSVSAGCFITGINLITFILAATINGG